MAFAAWLYAANMIVPWPLMLLLNLVVFIYSIVRIVFGMAWESVLFFASAFNPHSQGFLRQNVVNRWIEAINT